MFLLPSKLEVEDYLDFYFSKLRSFERKKYFIQNFNDITLIDLINQFTELIVRNPFSTPGIIQFATDNKISQSKINKYQRLFYLDVYREYKSGQISSEVEELFNSLAGANRSFQFLISLEKDDALAKLFKFNGQLFGVSNLK